MRPQERLAFISNLGTMLSAGIPVLEAVETLLPDSKGATKKFLNLLHDTLNEGKPISAAMQQMPNTFDPVTINIMRAAEESGTLEETLKDLEASMKNDQVFRDQLKASLAYPIFIFVIFLGVLLLILGFVVPRVARVFIGLRVKLPPVTKFMIEVSNFMLANYRMIILVAIVLAILFGVFLKFKHRTVVNLLLRLPLLSRLGREIDLSRFTRSMALLLKAGVPVGEALELSRAVVIKKEMVRMAENMSAAVEQGKPLAEGLQQSKSVVPIMMHRLIDTAERSGSLELSMQNLAEHFQTRVGQRLKTITTLTEPVMIVVVGLLVGGMMLAIIAPIYSLIGQVRTR